MVFIKYNEDLSVNNVHNTKSKFIPLPFDDATINNLISGIRRFGSYLCTQVKNFGDYLRMSQSDPLSQSNSCKGNFVSLASSLEYEYESVH